MKLCAHLAKIKTFLRSGTDVRQGLTYNWHSKYRLYAVT